MTDAEESFGVVYFAIYDLCDAQHYKIHIYLPAYKLTTAFLCCSLFSFVSSTLGSTPQTYFPVVPGISKATSGYNPCYNGNGVLSGNGALNFVDCQSVANAWRAAGNYVQAEGDHDSDIVWVTY